MNKPSLDELKIERSEAASAPSRMRWVVPAVFMAIIVAASWFFLFGTGGALEVTTARATGVEKEIPGRNRDDGQEGQRHDPPQR